MPTRILCPDCSAALRLSEAFVGKIVKCPKCASTFKATNDTSPEAPRSFPPRRHDEDDEETNEPERDRPTSKAGLWIGLLSALCIGLVVIVGVLLFSKNGDKPTPVVQAPPVQQLVPDAIAPQPPAANLPNNGNDFGNRFGGLAPEKALGNGERVKLSNPRYAKEGFSVFEKLCVDYEFTDGHGFGPRIGLTMMLKSGNQLSEATLFGLINNSGTIALDSFGLQKIPSGTEVWIAEKMGFGRFGPEPKRISNVVVIP